MFLVSNYEVFPPKCKVPVAESVSSWFSEFTVSPVRNVWGKPVKIPSLIWRGEKASRTSSEKWYRNICRCIVKHWPYITENNLARIPEGHKFWNCPLTYNFFLVYWQNTPFELKSITSGQENFKCEHLKRTRLTSRENTFFGTHNHR